MKRTLALLLMISLLIGMLPSVLAEDAVAYTGTVTNGSLHLRKEPSASAKVIDTYKAGTKVDILENDGTWCKVKVGKNTGYMMTQYLTIEANYPHLGWAVTGRDGTVLNLRAAADGAAGIVYKTLSGGVFELIEDAGDWYRVRYGNVFGYLEKAKLTPRAGDYAPGYTGMEAGEDAVALSRFRSAPREAGNPTSMTRSEGDFTYDFHFPGLGVPVADGEISGWLQETLRVFEEDRQKNHPDERASYTVEYQALKVDDRYESVLLAGEYKVGGLTVETMLALNIDREEAALLSQEDLFSLDPAHALFCLESAVTPLMRTPTDGYTNAPDGTWLRCAVLGRDGVEIYLPAGMYLPVTLGTRKISLTYNQTADCIPLDSAVIIAHRRVIDPEKPMIALTFDDGPSEETDRILTVLAQYNARATFCVIGNKVNTYADVLKRAIAGGNEIACHTWSHPKLTTLSVASIRSQITRTIDAVREVTGGYEIKVLRPPYGSVNKNVRSVCAELDLIIAHWEVDTKDWSTRNTKKTYNAIVKGAKNGVIVLCHDLYSTTAAAAEQVIPVLIEKGYQLVTVSELISCSVQGREPGHVYFSVEIKGAAE